MRRPRRLAPLRVEATQPPRLPDATGLDQPSGVQAFTRQAVRAAFGNPPIADSWSRNSALS